MLSDVSTPPNSCDESIKEDNKELGDLESIQEPAKVLEDKLESTTIHRDLTASPELISSEGTSSGSDGMVSTPVDGQIYPHWGELSTKRDDTLPRTQNTYGFNHYGQAYLMKNFLVLAAQD